MGFEDDDPAAAGGSINMTGKPNEITEEVQAAQPWRPENLTVKIPSGTMESSTLEVKIDVPSTPTQTPGKANDSPVCSPADYNTQESPGPSSRTKSPFRNFFSKFGIKSRNNSNMGVRKLPISRTSSLTKLFTPKMKRTLSLPVNPIQRSNPESLHGSSDVDNLDFEKFVRRGPIHRSLSVPVITKDGSNKPTDSVPGAVIRVTTATLSTDTTAATSDDPSSHAGRVGHESEDIPEEEAVCRICMVELGEGVETFKMECRCKGELALAHKDCLVKWFSIKGNKICEVCKEEVQNLPVTLLRIQSAQSVLGVRPENTRYRIWQDVPVLIIISMLAYFCFLEQLLVDKMKSGAITIALPFSCILGLLASVTSTTMVRKQYVWVYATLQFALVVLFAHIFYSKLRMPAVVSVLLSTVAGFGITMVVNYIVVESLRWMRISRLDQSQQSETSHHASQRRPDQSQQSETSHHASHHLDPGETNYPQPAAAPVHEFVPGELPALRVI